MPDELATASVPELIAAVALGSLIVSVILAIGLKFVAESIFKYPVHYFDALKSMMAATFLLTSVIIGLATSRAVDLSVSGGIALQIIGLAVSVVVLAFMVTAFIKSPEGRHPDFAQSGVVAAIMQVICLLIALAFTTMNFPLSGHV